MVTSARSGERRIDWESDARELLRMMKIFVLIVLMVMQVYLFAKTHQTRCILQYVDDSFINLIFFLIRKKKQVRKFEQVRRPKLWPKTVLRCPELPSHWELVMESPTKIKGKGEIQGYNDNIMRAGGAPLSLVISQNHKSELNHFTEVCSMKHIL